MAWKMLKKTQDVQRERVCSCVWVPSGVGVCDCACLCVGLCVFSGCLHACLYICNESVCASVYICAKKTANIQTLWSVFYHRGLPCEVWCTSRRKSIRYASDFFFFSSQKIQSANTNRRRTHRHSRIDNHSLRWHRTEPYPQRQQKKKQPTFPEETFTFEVPGFVWAPGKHMTRTFFLIYLKSRFLTVHLVWLFPRLGSVRRLWTWKKKTPKQTKTHSVFHSKVLSCQRSGHDMKKKRTRTTLQSCTFPRIRTQSTGQCLVEILKDTSRAAIDDRFSTRGLNRYS